MADVKIRALSVFEGVVYHCYALDESNPCRPVLEVEARTQPGDLESGPLLVTLADYARMAGGKEAVARCIDDLRARGRIVQWMGVDQLAFPTWTPVQIGD